MIIHTKTVPYRTDNRIEEEVVVCAACRTLYKGDAFIVVGIRHFDQFMHKQIKAYGLSLIQLEWEQGFLNNRGEFMSRIEALALADKAGQLKGRHLPEGLDSSDVW